MKMRSKEIRNRRGFTLVELLVSVALTVFMLTLFATLFSAGNDAVRIARGTSEVDRTVQSAITKLRRDLQFVYVGDNVSLGKAFSAPDQVPTAGYFTIEENMPGSPPPYLSDNNASNSIYDPSLKSFVQSLQGRVALTPIGYGGPSTPVTLYRQGIDERGLPVDADVDDVLAFTVKLTGNSPENVFYGRVPIGSILDSDLDPGSRFDQPDNGIFTSPYAEVIYFLRADRPYTLSDINRSALGSDDGRISTPATYTLYRRELLLLSPQQRTDVEKKITTGAYGAVDASGAGRTASALNDIARIQSIPNYLALNPTLNSANGAYYNPSVYQNYDVSFYFGFDSRKFTSGNVGNLTFFSLRFNDTNTIRLRQNRYGLQWLVTPPLNSILLQSPDAAAPGYDHPPIANALVRMYVPGPTPSGNTLWWHGRPTLYESTLVGATGVYDAAYNPVIGGGHLASYDTLSDKSSAYYTTTAPTSDARRRDADVLLNNVISFDVKVLNDDIVQGLNTAVLGLGTTGSVYDPVSGTYRVQPIPTADPASWPGARTSALAALDPVFNTTILPARPGQLAANASRPWLASLSAGLIQQDFVDIGYSLTPEMTATPFMIAPSPLTPTLVMEPVNLSASITTIPTNPAAIPWGSQTPARWMSTGRRESSYNFYMPTAMIPLGMVYDTWAPEYRPELFANNLLGAPITVSPQPFLPPYDRPIRGLQITIRILEPKTGLTREFQIVHRFN